MTEDAEETPETVMDTDTKTALAEVIALAGAQGQIGRDSETSQTVQATVEEAPIVRLANTILQSAVKEKASDIHFEPDRRYIRVRFRIDGILHEVMQMPGYIKQPLTNRYKILADVNIIEYRVPQQGYIGTRYDGNAYNLRVHFSPTSYGEKIVMRVSDAQGPNLALNQIGLTSEAQTQAEGLLGRRGLLILAGERGQGKTTTQYVLLNKLNTVDNGTFAVSNYYDFTPAGISQACLNPRIGYTADAALRSIADLDADVVAIDQGRDLTTLPTALQMAASGVLMLSTLDAADALRALRLLQSAADTDLLTENLSGILAQKLVRRICTNCKEDYLIPANDLRRFGYGASNPDERVQVARGAGCELCRKTGYKGRIALFELLTLNDQLADMVSRGAKRAALLEAARAGGMKDLREDSLIKILQGVTTPEEVAQVVST